jgi:hypothetical protein
VFEGLITGKSKFALIAIKNAYTDFTPSDNFSHKLKDGTWILSKVPVEIDKGWREWIGSLRYDSFLKSNLVFLTAEPSENPGILDAHHKRLGDRLSQLFNVLQLQGVIEYQDSNLIIGSFYDKRSELRQMAKLPVFYRTKGYIPPPVDVSKLENTVLMRKALEQIDKFDGAFIRFIRGWNILMDGLQKNNGEGRIHQFVRSLEALILPNIGKTKRQFVHRCQTFAVAHQENNQILTEAFDLRSMSEHLNDWQTALSSYPEDQREDLALLRTRQMERLACFAYARILENRIARCHFESEIEMEAFWRMQENKRIQIWGNQLDLRSVA